jgi:hypothetical protein
VGPESLALSGERNRGLPLPEPVTAGKTGAFRIPRLPRIPNGIGAGRFESETS